jgi:hypothetical protein
MILHTTANRFVLRKLRTLQQKQGGGGPDHESPITSHRLSLVRGRAGPANLQRDLRRGAVARQIRDEAQRSVGSFKRQTGLLRAGAIHAPLPGNRRRAIRAASSKLRRLRPLRSRRSQIRQNRGRSPKREPPTANRHQNRQSHRHSNPNGSHRKSPLLRL